MSWYLIWAEASLFESCSSFCFPSNAKFVWKREKWIHMRMIWLFKYLGQVFEKFLFLLLQSEKDQTHVSKNSNCLPIDLSNTVLLKQHGWFMNFCQHLFELSVKERNHSDEMISDLNLHLARYSSSVGASLFDELVYCALVTSNLKFLLVTCTAQPWVSLPVQHNLSQSTRERREWLPPQPSPLFLSPGPQVISKT